MLDAIPIRLVRLIGLTGRAGAGKTTIARALEERGFARHPFAGPLKAMARAFYESCGCTPEAIEARIAGDLKEEDDPLLGGASPRFMMQTLGTEWGRDMVDADLWTRAWRSGVLLPLAAGAAIVVDDVRFPNEVEEVRRLGGYVVRLEGHHAAGAARSAFGHASEIGVAADLEVANEGPPEHVADFILGALSLRTGLSWID